MKRSGEIVELEEYIDILKGVSVRTLQPVKEGQVVALFNGECNNMNDKSAFSTFVTQSLSIAVKPRLDPTSHYQLTIFADDEKHHLSGDVYRSIAGSMNHSHNPNAVFQQVSVLYFMDFIYHRKFVIYCVRAVVKKGIDF